MTMKTDDWGFLMSPRVFFFFFVLYFWSFRIIWNFHLWFLKRSIWKRPYTNIHCFYDRNLFKKKPSNKSYTTDVCYSMLYATTIDTSYIIAQLDETPRINIFKINFLYVKEKKRCKEKVKVAIRVFECVKHLYFIRLLLRSEIKVCIHLTDFC